MMTNPSKIEHFARLTNEIVRSHSQPSTVHATFLLHLIDFCHHATNYCFKDNSSTTWSQVNVLGVFLAQLYRLDCLKNFNLISIWLTQVYKRALVSEDETASKAFLTILESLSEKIMQRNLFSLHKQQLQKLSILGKVPSNFQQWSIKTLAHQPEKSTIQNEPFQSTSNQVLTGVIRRS